MCSRKLIMIYSNNRSRRDEPRTREESGVTSPRALNLDNKVIQASLSHSVIARESKDADFVERPARWVLSIVWMDWRIRSIEAWNSVWRDSKVRDSEGGSSKVWIAWLSRFVWSGWGVS